MKDDWGPLNAKFMGGLGIGIAIGVFFLLIAPTFSAETYCVEGETPISCYREWSMMFATWAAAAVGIGAAYFVYQTIIKMNEQITESRRQTAFIVGDEKPTLEMLQSNYFEGGCFRIVNWNRRPITIAAAVWTCDAEVIPNDMITLEGINFKMRDGGFIDGNRTMPGWENRSAGPTTLEGNFTPRHPGGEAWAEDRMKEMTLTLAVIVLGERRKIVHISAHAYFSEVVSASHRDDLRKFEPGHSTSPSFA